MTHEQAGMVPLRPEEEQRGILNRREREIRRFQQRVRSLLVTMPLEFAQTEAGARLMEALQGAEDNLTNSRRALRGETSPLVKEPIDLSIKT